MENNEPVTLSFARSTWIYRLLLTLCVSVNTVRLCSMYTNYKSGIHTINGYVQYTVQYMHDAQTDKSDASIVICSIASRCYTCYTNKTNQNQRTKCSIVLDVFKANGTEKTATFCCLCNLDKGQWADWITESLK